MDEPAVAVGPGIRVLACQATCRAQPQKPRGRRSSPGPWARSIRPRLRVGVEIAIKTRTNPLKTKLVRADNCQPCGMAQGVEADAKDRASQPEMGLIPAETVVGTVPSGVAHPMPSRSSGGWSRGEFEVAKGCCFWTQKSRLRF